MRKEFTALVFASLIIFVAVAAAEGIIPPRMGEVGVIVLPALAFATMQFTTCCKAARGYSL